jgi:ribosomal protein S18 acetylase RimI-like enzyme
MASSDAVIDYRPASISDIDALLHLENTCFQYDRLSRRSFRHHIGSSTCDLIVAQHSNEIVGYALAFYRKGSKEARLYSLAVNQSARGLGVGRGLMAAIETAAIARGHRLIRLEVATTNAVAIALYESQGYSVFGLYRGFYENHGDALRMRKRLFS